MADGIVAGKEARLQLADPIPALGEAPNPGCLAKWRSIRRSSNCCIVEGAEFRRQAAQRPDQPELRGDGVNDESRTAPSRANARPCSASRCASTSGSPAARRFVFDWLPQQAA